MLLVFVLQGQLETHQRNLGSVLCRYYGNGPIWHSRATEQGNVVITIRVRLQERFFYSVHVRGV